MRLDKRDDIACATYHSRRHVRDGASSLLAAPSCLPIDHTPSSNQATALFGRAERPQIVSDPRSI